MMTQKEFDEIYPKGIKREQHDVLEAFLQGHTDQTIARMINEKREAASASAKSTCRSKKSKESVRHDILNICKFFGFENKRGEHYRQRNELIPLFCQYKPELVSAQLRESSLLYPDLQKILEFPDKPLSFNSSFYVERPPIESDCHETILQPGSMIRIKAPKKLGKTSLLNRLVAHTKDNYRLVRLNLMDVEVALFNKIDDFFKWFCLNISKQLQLESQVDKYWQVGQGIGVNCKAYFQAEVLEVIDSPIILIIEELDLVFPYVEVAEQFLTMLRSWFEETTKTDIWENLRMVLLYSTEAYVKLPFNQSPFNVGFMVELSEFSQKAVQELAKRHQLDWGTDEVVELMAVIGGYPYLVRMALYRLARQEFTLKELLRMAATDVGIYKAHLNSCWAGLQKYPELQVALGEVVNADNSVKLEQLVKFKLLGTGLVKEDTCGIIPSCQLYQDYFRLKFRD